MDELGAARQVRDHRQGAGSPRLAAGRLVQGERGPGSRAAPARSGRGNPARADAQLKGLPFPQIGALRGTQGRHPSFDLKARWPSMGQDDMPNPIPPDPVEPPIPPELPASPIPETPAPPFPEKRPEMPEVRIRS